MLARHVDGEVASSRDACPRLLAALLGVVFCAGTSLPSAASFVVVDTHQERCYNNNLEIPCPAPGQAFYGQDAQKDGMQPDYQDNGDGTVTDLTTGLMWQRSFAWDMSWADAVAGAAGFDLAGYDDWRLPTIKELYSLIAFNGVCGTDSSSSTPFIDRGLFDFAYGHPRFIDHQEWSSTSYVGTVFGGDAAAFGVNFADGRIKGYPRTMLGEVRYVRGAAGYGANDFRDNGDGTVIDQATGLMWSQADCGSGLNWASALAWVAAQNVAGYLGHSDWRLPNAKELESIVDYTRAPDVTGSPALDPVFDSTAITNEGGQTDYPYFWASTTHVDGPPNIQGSKAVYVSFGRALGWMEIPPGSGHWVLQDVHGAGAQRSDPKSGDPASYPHGNGPQGDVVRIRSFVRLVRDSGPANSVPTPGSSLRPNSLDLLGNPGHGSLAMQLSLADDTPGDLSIYDMKGRRVVTLDGGLLRQGERNVVWRGRTAEGRSVAPGIYIVRLETRNFVRTAKLTLLR